MMMGLVSKSWLRLNQILGPAFGESIFLHDSGVLGCGSCRNPHLRCQLIGSYLLQGWHPVMVSWQNSMKFIFQWQKSVILWGFGGGLKVRLWVKNMFTNLAFNCWKHLKWSFWCLPSHLLLSIYYSSLEFFPSNVRWRAGSTKISPSWFLWCRGTTKPCVPVTK